MSEQNEQELAKNTLSRRSFLKVGGVAVGTVALAGYSHTANAIASTDKKTADTQKLSFLIPPPPIKDSQIKKTVTVDVLVIGAGVSGIPAASIAAEMGARVHVIDKQNNIVSTRPTGFSCFGSKLLKEQGVMCTEAEKEALVKDLWGSQNATGKFEIIKLWADKSGEYADWMIPIIENGGIKVQVGGLFGYYNHNKTIEEALVAMRANPLSVRDSYWQFYPLQHQFGSSNIPGVSAWAGPQDVDWLSILYKYSLSKGATYDFTTSAHQLVREPGWEKDPTKRVIGVIAQNAAGEYIKYMAKKGVVLATGGFDYNDEMLKAYYPIGLRMCRTWQRWFTGDGHKMAVWVGAKMDDQFTSHVMGTAAMAKAMKSKDKIMPPEAQAHVVPWREWNMPSTPMAPCLWVNNLGKRFINEEVGYFMSATTIDAQPDHMYWGVWDSQWKAKVIPHHMDRLMDGNDSDERMEANVKSGMAIKANTIEELIKKMGVVDGAAFKKTLSEYNAMVEAGKDTLYYKPKKYLSTVDTGPFYAAQMGTSYMTTCGGLITDTNLSVLDENQNVIPGLFAGGNPAGGFYGNIYAPQVPMSLSGHSMTFSWLAAKNAVSGV